MNIKYDIFNIGNIVCYKIIYKNHENKKFVHKLNDIEFNTQDCRQIYTLNYNGYYNKK